MASCQQDEAPSLPFSHPHLRYGRPLFARQDFPDLQAQVSRPLPSQPSLNSLYLEPYHIYPGANYAVLWPKSAANPGIIGYMNGTAADFANENADLLFNFNPAPYGFIIDPVNATYNPILINTGNGTTGIFIDQGIIKYHNPISGEFCACSNTLSYGAAVQLLDKPKVINTLKGCSDVELVVECVE